MRYLLIILLTILISDTNSKWEDSDKELELIKESLKNIPIEKKELPMWEVKQYVDEYGDLVGDKYISNTILIEGTFSNSAVTNEKLLVEILIGKKYIDFILYEYGSRRVKDKSGRIYRVGLKHNGDIISTSKFNRFPPCEARMGTDRIRVKGGRKFKRLKNAFLEGGDLKFHIVQQITGIESEYKFALLDLDGTKIKDKLSNLK